MRPLHYEENNSSVSQIDCHIKNIQNQKKHRTDAQCPHWKTSSQSHANTVFFFSNNYHSYGLQKKDLCRQLFLRGDCRLPQPTKPPTPYLPETFSWTKTLKNFWGAHPRTGGTPHAFKNSVTSSKLGIFRPLHYRSVKTPENFLGSQKNNFYWEFRGALSREEKNNAPQFLSVSPTTNALEPISTVSHVIEYVRMLCYWWESLSAI